MRHLSAYLVALLCAVSCVTVAGVEVWPAGRDVRTGDQNGDGRADIWRRFDTRGQLTEVEVDTNFDGSPDIAEYYQPGALVARGSNRNFKGQADVVEEFDPDTHGRTRSGGDIDYDGTADLLVVFRNGGAAFSKLIHALKKGPKIQARDRTPAYQRSADHMTALIDPSESDTS